MIRNISAILVGYLIFGISSALLFGISKVDPSQPAAQNFMILSGLVGGLSSLMGGYVTGMMIKDKKKWPVITLSILMFLVALVSILAQPGKSYWSQFLTMFVFVPLTLIGGLIRLRQK